MNEPFQYSFPIKIFRKAVNETIKNNIEKEIQGCSKDILEFVNDNHFSQDNQPLFSDATFRSNFIIEHNLSTLQTVILDYAKEYLNEYNSTEPIYFKKSWITYCKKYSWGHNHHHNDCKISGVYYYQTDKLSGNLRLYSPLQFSSFNHNFIDITPESGTIVMFPGWMGHEILPTKSESLRISIAFNLI